MKIVALLCSLTALFFAIPNPMLDWSKRTRAIIILSLAIAALLFVVEALYQFYKRRVARLRLKHKSTAGKLNASKKTLETGITDLNTTLKKKDEDFFKLQMQWKFRGDDIETLKEKVRTLQSELERIENEHGDKVIELVEANTKALINQEKKHWVVIEGLKAEID